MSRKTPMFLIAAGFAGAALLVALDARAVEQGKGRADPVKEGLSANDRMIGAKAQGNGPRPCKQIVRMQP